VTSFRGLFPFCAVLLAESANGENPFLNMSRPDELKRPKKRKYGLALPRLAAYPDFTIFSSLFRLAE
jgi:hypothetical protein